MTESPIDSHEWSKPIRYAGSIADGAPPGRNHRQAVVYECAWCHLVRIEPMTEEQALTMRDGLPNVVKRTVAAGQWWDGRTPCTPHREEQVDRVYQALLRKPDDDVGRAWTRQLAEKLVDGGFANHDGEVSEGKPFTRVEVEWCANCGDQTTTVEVTERAPAPFERVHMCGPCLRLALAALTSSAGKG
jgi:hypothetical protein